MAKNQFGGTYYKLALHLHTTVSDGRKTPSEVAREYKQNGYDAIAFTDHWKYNDGGTLEDLFIISGCEYNLGGNETITGVSHIVSLFTKENPNIDRNANGQEVVDAINREGGVAVLAHPAWSLNSHEAIMAVEGFDATEIYNAVSDAGMSFRPDSSLLVDMLASRGVCYPLLATDDAHYYEGDDDCVAYIMAECDPSDSESIKSAIKEGRFYATQGPEIHLSRDGDVFRVDCSPVSKIVFASNKQWTKGRVFRGENLTSAEYALTHEDTFIRAFIVDKDSKCAWSNIIKI
jgi:hypothetical protein